MTAVIYARYSSDNQREESIEGQIRECTAYADRSRKAHKWLYFPLQAYPCGFLFPAPVRHPTQLSTTYRQFGVKVV